MSGLCEFALGLGIALTWCDVPVTQADIPLGKGDVSAWQFTPPPEKEKPQIEFKNVVIEKEKSPPLPPFVIEKTIIKEVEPQPPQIIENVIYIEKDAPPAPTPDYSVEYFNQLYMMRKNPNTGAENGDWSNIKSNVGDGEPLSSLNMPSKGDKLGNPDIPEKVKLAKYEADNRDASAPIENEYIFTADRYITGILENGINSQLDSEDGSTFIVQVSEDAFGYHGRRKLIPKGSRLLCTYQSPEKIGVYRLKIECNRLLIGGYRAEIYDLAAKGGDVQGHFGLSGEVDNRFYEKYGTAFLLTGISTAVRIASAGVPDTNGTSYADLANEGSTELSEKLGEITASVLEETVNLSPIIRLAQGTRITIRPGKDWYIKPPSMNN